MKKTSWLSLFFAVAFSFSLVGCHDKGPAQQAGEDIDQKVDQIKSAVNPGPAQQAGQKIDSAVQKVKDATNSN